MVLYCFLFILIICKCAQTLVCDRKGQKLFKHLHTVPCGKESKTFILNPQTSSAGVTLLSATSLLVRLSIWSRAKTR